MNVKPSKSPWWMALTTSDCIGVNSAFSEIKSTSKLLKSRLDLCMCVVGRRGREEGEQRGEGEGKKGEEKGEEGRREGKKRKGERMKRRGGRRSTNMVRFPCAPEGLIILMGIN